MGTLTGSGLSLLTGLDEDVRILPLRLGRVLSHDGKGSERVLFPLLVSFLLGIVLTHT